MSLLVSDIFRRAAAASPDRPAASLDGEVLTFGRLEEEAALMGLGLVAHGVGRGDRVAWWGGTALAAVPLFAALSELGAAFVPVNAGLGPTEAAAVLSRARPGLLVTTAEAGSEAKALADSTGVPLAHVSAGAGPGADLRAAGLGALGSGREHRYTGFGEVPGERDPHVIFFTSGSTGEPKGVVVSQRANYLRSLVANFSASPGATVCMFPLFHMASWTLALGCWQSRREVALVARPDADSLLGAIEGRRARRVYLIPAVWHRVLSQLAAAPGRWDLSSLEEADTGTSATPPELLEAIGAALPGATTRVMYGSTEAGSVTSLAPEDIGRKPGSVGVPTVGADVALGPDGEIVVRSDYLMDGYFDDPVGSATAIVDGWYHTGDLGSFDDEGYLSVVGRCREVIRTGGETVAPAEVEAVLASLDGVAEVAVVGVPDDQWGEVICAVVVARAGAQLGLETIREGCADRLAPFKQPRRIELVETLPRTPATGQVQRSLILERLRATAGPRATGSSSTKG